MTGMASTGFDSEVVRSPVYLWHASVNDLGAVSGGFLRLGGPHGLCASNGAEVGIADPEDDGGVDVVVAKLDGPNTVHWNQEP